MVVIAAILYTLCLLPYGTAEDDHASLLLGHALATGQGYHMIAMPHAPVEATIPPGYPMMLAPIMFVIGDLEQSLLPVRLLTVLFAAGFVIVTWFLLDGRIERRPAYLLVLLTALSPYVIDGAGLITADMGYALLSLLSLLMIDRWLFADCQTTVPMRRLVWTVLLCAIVYFMHIIGVALVAATVIRLISQRRYYPAGAVGLGFLILALPWNLWIIAQDGDTYIDLFLLKDPDFAVLGSMGFLDGIGRIGRHVWHYLAYLIPGGLAPLLVESRITEWFGTTGLMPFLVILRLGITGLVLRGLYTLLRRRPTIVHCYFISHMIILLVWPWASWRFILPVLPLLWMYLYQSLRDIGNLTAVSSSVDRVRQVCAVAVVFIALVGSLLHDTESLMMAHASRRGELPPQAAALRSASAWLQAETHPESVLMCIDVPQWYALSGRHGVRPPSVPTPDAILGTLIYYEVGYVISVSSPGYRVKDLNGLLIEPMVSAYADIFTPVYRSPGHPGVTVYAVSRSAANRMALANPHVSSQ